VPQPGQIALLAFPRTDLAAGKRRPVLLVAPTPDTYDDWLVCMLSTQLGQAIPGFDEIIDTDASDFAASGLRTTSAIRVSRLAVVSSDLLIGALGTIDPSRLRRVRDALSDWVHDRLGPSST